MKVTFDLDGVIIEQLPYVLKHIGKNINDVTSYYIKNIDSLSENEKKLIMASFHNADTFKRAYKHSDVLNRIAMNNEVIINSFSCNADVANYKACWINSDIRNVKPENIILDIMTTGKNVVKFIGKTDVYVEDCLENLLNNVGKYKVVILIDKPYNKCCGLNHYNIHRVKDVYEAERLINTLNMKCKQRHNCNETYIR